MASPERSPLGGARGCRRTARACLNHVKRLAGRFARVFQLAVCARALVYPFLTTSFKLRTASFTSPTPLCIFAFGLMLQPFDLVLFAADQLAGFFLDLAADVLRCALNLILVHGHVDFLQ